MWIINRPLNKQPREFDTNEHSIDTQKRKLYISFNINYRSNQTRTFKLFRVRSMQYEYKYNNFERVKRKFLKITFCFSRFPCAVERDFSVVVVRGQ